MSHPSFKYNNSVTSSVFEWVKINRPVQRIFLGINVAVICVALSGCGSGLNSSPFTSFPSGAAVTTTPIPIATPTASSSPTSTVTPTPYIYVEGVFTSFNGTTATNFVALNNDGSVFSGFNANGSGANVSINSWGVDPTSGRIIVTGLFTTYNGTSELNIARLNIDGTLDSTFNSAGTFNNNIRSMAIDSSGRPYVGGWFTSYNGVTVDALARFNTDGSLDTSFAPVGTGLNSYTYGIAFDGLGNVFVAGNATNYNGTTRNYAIKLKSNGSLDTSFAPVGTGINWLTRSVFVTNSGDVLIGGEPTSYNGTSEKYVMRLSSDGSLDTSFNPVGTGLNNFVTGSLFADSNGKIWATGTFTSYNGTSLPGLVRLNSDGSLDTTFALALAGAGFNGTVSSVVVDANMKVVVVGSFTTVNGISEPHVARLNYDGSLDTSFNVGTGPNASASGVAIYP